MDNLISKIEFCNMNNELQQEITRLENDIHLYKSDEVKSGELKNDETMSNKAESELTMSIHVNEFDWLNKLFNGDLWDDTFYNNIIEKIVINKCKIVVKLKYITDEFTFNILGM